MATKAGLPVLKGSFLKVAGLNICRALYSPHYSAPFVAASILSDPTHVLYPQTKQRFDTRSRETLWWNATSNTIHTAKKVLRSWNSRRMRRAFIEALETYGFDAEGKPTTDKVKGQARGLQGTLIIHALPSILSVKFAYVKQQMELLVKELVRRRS